VRRKWVAVLCLLGILVLVAVLPIPLFQSRSFAQESGVAWLGVKYQRGETEGDFITYVEPYSSADMAGLQKCDYIIAMFKVQHRWDGSYTFRLSDSSFRLRNYQTYCRPGDLVAIVFWRDDSSSWLRYARTPYITVAVMGSR